MKISDLLLWQAFQVVAQEKNFSKAARILKTQAPNVTKRITTLEAQLGVRLFNRTTRVVSLTKEGEFLLPSARSLIDQAIDLERQASDRHSEISGTIRLTCFVNFGHRWLAPVLEEFSRKFPLVHLDVEVTDRIVDLIEEQFDIAIRIQEPQGADFVFKELMGNQLAIFATPEYVKTHRPIRTPQDLVHHEILTIDLHQNLKFNNSPLRLKDVTKKRSLHCESTLFMAEMALQGYGVGIVSGWGVANFIKKGQLVPLLEKYPLEWFRRIYMVIPQKRYLTNRVRALADFIVEKAKT